MIEFDFTRDREEPIPDQMRLEVGHMVAFHYINGALDFPVGYDVQGAATYALEQIGFSRVEWVQDPSNHDILLLLLWRHYEGKVIDEFILEFSGTDDMVITLFNFIKERVVGVRPS